MIREQIKSQTAQAHMEVEQFSYVNEIMNGSLSKDQYANILKMNYIINACFEAQWDSVTFEIPQSLLLQERRKTALLEQDIMEMDIDLPALPDLKFPIHSYPSFLGTLYVFEGSTLGGAVIHRQLKAIPELSALSSFSFYSAYGEKLGMMWKLFLDHLSLITDPQEIEDAISAAQLTFERIKEVMSKH